MTALSLGFFIRSPHIVKTGGTPMVARPGEINEMRVYRGSRKHVLDWCEQPRFIPELLALAEPATPRVSAQSLWMPLGYDEACEAELVSFGPLYLPDSPVWTQLRRWWLTHERGAKTPNWDIVLGCELEGEPGLILVEAKANKKELKVAGKLLDDDGSYNSRDNHAQIGSAIEEACKGLRSIHKGISLSRDSHYQLANRLAFTWKLAALGVPTVLIYLGFYADTGIGDVGEPFADAEDWKRTFEVHAAPSGISALCERKLDCGAAPAWVFVRARAVLQSSHESARVAV
jgi:hypothetical protein